MKITIEILEDLEACKDGLDWFIKQFPDGTTIKNLVEKINNNHWLGWLMHCRIDITRECIKAGANVNAGNNYALRFASKHGYIDIIRLLLKNGANVHAKNNFALRYASSYGHTNIVKLLLASGANICPENDFALQWARRHGHTAIVKLLEKHIKKEQE